MTKAWRCSRVIFCIEEATAFDNNVTKLLNKLRERLHEADYKSNLCFEPIKSSKLLETPCLPEIFGTPRTVHLPNDLADDLNILMTMITKMAMLSRVWSFR